MVLMPVVSNPSVWEAELSYWRCIFILPGMGPRCTPDPKWEAARGGVWVHCVTEWKLTYSEM